MQKYIAYTHVIPSQNIKTNHQYKKNLTLTFHHQLKNTQTLHQCFNIYKLHATDSQGKLSYPHPNLF